MAVELADAVERLVGQRPRRIVALGGGCIAPVHRCDLPDGARIVAKQPSAGRSLDCEAWMLRYLRASTALPVPAVVAAEPGLLLIDYIESGGPLDGAAEIHAAELLAALHRIAGPAFGFERDTVIGALDQPNPRAASWRGFFGEHRLLHRARCAAGAGRLPSAMLARVERLVGRLDRWLEEPAYPALIHGDAWRGNVLVRKGRVAAFIDPAIYWAHPEIELAFGTLFGTFGTAFFRRYGEVNPLSPGFFEARRDLYNLYPLLVHAELFGGSYVGAVAAGLAKFGV